MFMLQVGVLQVIRDTKTNITARNFHCEEVLKSKKDSFHITLVEKKHYGYLAPA
jgi:hypothetical protein